MFAVLTDRGLEALRRTWPSCARGIARHFGRHLTDEETHVLTKALSKVLAAAREGEPAPH